MFIHAQGTACCRHWISAFWIVYGKYVEPGRFVRTSGLIQELDVKQSSFKGRMRCRFGTVSIRVLSETPSGNYEPELMYFCPHLKSVMLGAGGFGWSFNVAR